MEFIPTFKQKIILKEAKQKGYITRSELELIYHARQNLIQAIKVLEKSGFLIRKQEGLWDYNYGVHGVEKELDEYFETKTEESK